MGLISPQAPPNWQPKAGRQVIGLANGRVERGRLLLLGHNTAYVKLEYGVKELTDIMPPSEQTEFFFVDELNKADTLKI
jgi:hypothetical protein